MTAPRLRRRGEEQVVRTPETETTPRPPIGPPSASETTHLRGLSRRPVTAQESAETVG